MNNEFNQAVDQTFEDIMYEQNELDIETLLYEQETIEMGVWNELG